MPVFYGIPIISRLKSGPLGEKGRIPLNCWDQNILIGEDLSVKKLTRAPTVTLKTEQQCKCPTVGFGLISTDVQ